MKTTSRRIFAALLGLYVLSVMVRGAGADEIADWMAEMRRQNDEFNRQAYEEREARDKFNREAYEEREARDKFNREAQEERDARDKWNRQVQEERDAQDKFNRETQAERDAWYKWNREVQEWRDSQKKQEEWDDWLNRLTGSAQSGGPAAGPAPAGQIRFSARAAPQEPLLILNPFVSQQMAPQIQERVSQQRMPTRQQMMQGTPGVLPQLIQNPFVGSSP